MDNQEAMLTASNMITNKIAMHIDLRYNMIRAYIAKGPFKL